MDNASLRKVDTVDEAAEFLRWLGERRSILAIDTETTGLEWWTPDFLRLVQFGDSGTGWVVSGREWKGVVRAALSAYIGPVVFHNANFDLHALESAGLPLPQGAIHDTKIMDALVTPLASHSLKPMSDRLLGREASMGQAMLKGHFARDKVSWDTVSEDDPAYWGYAALDTVLTARIADILLPQVQTDVYDVEMAAQEVLYRAERRGLGLDLPYTETLWQEWELELNRLGQELADFGVGNPNAARQIRAALEEYEKWEPEYWTPTGEAVLDDKVLRSLGGDIGPRVLRFRRLRKWRSAYVGRFLSGRDAQGRIHPSINTLRARTGRMSITSPALQTLPGKKSGGATTIRDCIVPAPGSSLLAVDYDGQELRVFAAYSGDAALIDAVTNNPDPHRWVASRVYGVPEEQVTSVQRETAKNVQYARIYGAGVNKMVETANANPKVEEKVTAADIERFLALYDAALPGVSRFMESVDAVARQRLADDGAPWVRSWGGRRLEAEPDKIYTLTNYLIQGSCADLLKRKIVALDSAGLGDYIALPVHDELLFEIPDTVFDDARTEIAQIMHSDDFAVPLTVHPSEALTRWGDAYR